MKAEKLEALSRQLGVEPGFEDNWGVQRVASKAALTAIVNALDSDSPAQGEDDLSGESQAASEKIADGVIVVQCGTTHTIALPQLASQQLLSTIQLRWQLKAEATSNTDHKFSEQIVSGLVVALTPDNASASAEAAQDSRRLEISVSEEMLVGYHSLILSFSQGEQIVIEQSLQLIVVPRAAWMPASSAPSLGITLQLYSLRSDSNWGIGDFGDLKNMCSIAASFGVDAVGVNPLHLLYTAHPERCSPYSPSSRCLLNPVYIDVTQVPGVELSERYLTLTGSDDFKQSLADLQKAELIDYVAVYKLKLAALYAVFLDFYTSESSDGLKKSQKVSSEVSTAQAAFDNFIDKADSALLLHARFAAFDQHFSETQGLLEWNQWPLEYQSVDSPDSELLAVELASSIRFQLFLEWQATTQLDDVTEHCHAQGMVHGLYLDLAVGVDRSGGDIWANQNLYAKGLHIGAPPDELGPLGQDWSLTPWNPSALRDTCYQPFVQLLRSSMRYAGILRLDHVMGLMRQYWCVPELPSEGEYTNGAYVEFPLTDLLGILSLESHRNKCLVVGEDLGTVPDGFRQQLEARSILGYRVLYFEREDNGAYKHPSTYTACSLATASTHDLPPLAGFLQGLDLKRRAELGLLPENQSLEEELEKRAADLLHLKDLSQRPEIGGVQSVGSSCAPRDSVGSGDTHEFIEQVHLLLSRAASRLVMLQLEDLCASGEMVNMPGTIDEHPNWRRRMTDNVDDLTELLGKSGALQEVVKHRKVA